MSARVARRPWSKSRSSAIWRTTPEQTATAAGGAGRPALRRHPDLVRRELEAALDRLHDFGGPTLGQVAPVDAPGGAQLVAVSGRALREGEESQVRQHHAAGPVGLGRRAFAPCGHFLGHGAGAT